MSPARRLVDVFVDHPKIDYVATAVVVGAVVWIASEGLIAPTEHGSLYQTLASVSGILLSLGAIIITLVFTVTPNDRLTMIVDSVGDRLLRLVMSSLGMLVITTVGFMTLYALDGHRVPRLGVLASCHSNRVNVEGFEVVSVGSRADLLYRGDSTIWRIHLLRSFR